MVFRMCRWVFALCSIFTLASCSSFRPRGIPALTNSYCVPSVQYAYDTTYLPKPTIQDILQTDTLLVKRYSQHDLLLANAIGVLPLLQQLVLLEKHPVSDNQLTVLSIRQKILNRFLLASTQIASLAAELDCEGERADQIATYLDQRDTRRIRRLTILSIVIGAATTVATTLLTSDNTSKVIGISGGIVGAGFGGLAAFSSNRTVTFRHQRNLLTDIWQQSDTSSVYPPMIWYILNEKSFSNTHQVSIHYTIRERWKNYVLSPLSSDQEQLYFGEGGDYQADDLHNRANMLNQLQSSIRSINQDLQSLAITLAN